MNYYFLIGLLACCGYSLWRGDRDARIAAIVCVAASVLTMALLTPGSHRYQLVESGAMLVDVATLAAFIMLALVSNHFWPLWIAGLQLTASTAHALKMIDADLVPLAYAVAERFWSYPILLIIAIGAWRAHRRRMQFSTGIEQPA